MLGCCWHWLTLAEPAGSWLAAAGLLEADIGHKYLASVYWALTTVTTVGYGDITAVNADERLFSIFGIIVGAFVFGYVVYNVSVLLERQGERSSVLREHMDNLKDYLRDRKASIVLQNRLRRHLDFYYQHRSPFQEQQLLQAMPDLMRLQVMKDDILSMQRTIHLLHGKEAWFTLHLLNIMHPFYISAAEVLYRTGDLATEFYFIANGSLELRLLLPDADGASHASHGGRTAEDGKEDAAGGGAAAGAAGAAILEEEEEEGDADGAAAGAAAAIEEDLEGESAEEREAAVHDRTSSGRRATGDGATSEEASSEDGEGEDDDDDDFDGRTSSIELRADTEPPLPGSVASRPAEPTSTASAEPPSPTQSKALLKTTSCSTDVAAAADADDGDCAEEADYIVFEHLSAGVHFGYHSLVCGTVRAVDAVPTSSCELYFVAKHDLAHFADRFVVMARQLVRGSREYAKRLAIARERAERVSADRRSSTPSLSTKLLSPLDGVTSLSAAPILLRKRSSTGAEPTDADEADAVAAGRLAAPAVSTLELPERKDDSRSDTSSTGGRRLSGSSALSTDGRVFGGYSGDEEEKDVHASGMLPSLSAAPGSAAGSGASYSDDLIGRDDAFGTGASSKSDGGYPRHVAMLRKGLVALSVRNMLAESSRTAAARLPGTSLPLDTPPLVMWTDYRIIHPELPTKVMWDLWLAVWIMYTTLVVPFRIGFKVEPVGFALVLDRVIDVLFLLDILANFRTAFINAETREFCADAAGIRRHYLRRWFLIDFLSTVPFDLLGQWLLGGTSSALRSAKLLRLLRLSRLLKLMRLAKLSKFFGQYEHMLHVNPALIKLLKLFLSITVVAHLFACAWNWSAVLPYEDATAPLKSATWMYNYCTLVVADCPATTDDHSYWYLASVYWAFATITTVGFGDMRANLSSPPELAVAMVSMLMGTTVFAYLIGTLMNVVLNFDKASSKLKMHLNILKHYMHDKNLSLQMKKRVKKHYEYFLTVQSVFDEQDILRTLPLFLRRRLVMAVHGERVLKVPMFRELEARFPGFLAVCAPLLTPVCLREGDTTVVSGEMERKMLIVIKGRCELMADAFTKPLVLSEGSFFGEMALFLPEARATKMKLTAKALQECLLLSMSKATYSHLKRLSDDLSKAMLQLLKEGKPYDWMDNGLLLRAEDRSSHGAAASSAASAGSGGGKSGMSMPAGGGKPLARALESARMHRMRKRTSMSATSTALPGYAGRRRKSAAAAPPVRRVMGDVSDASGRVGSEDLPAWAEVSRLGTTSSVPSRSAGLAELRVVADMLSDSEDSPMSRRASATASVAARRAPGMVTSSPAGSGRSHRSAGSSDGETSSSPALRPLLMSPEARAESLRRRSQLQRMGSLEI
eukprot:PLAT3643.3.p1 GENE.PLAT3643.3~~PLAT3643.3.p1  ORF type:complete len:1420 (-),score=813.14 PLAT3643.3:357-4490(-)